DVHVGYALDVEQGSRAIEALARDTDPAVAQIRLPSLSHEPKQPLRLQVEHQSLRRPSCRADDAPQDRRRQPEDASCNGALGRGGEAGTNVQTRHKAEYARDRGGSPHKCDSL